jgi:hypothetical protein
MTKSHAKVEKKLKSLERALSDQSIITEEPLKQSTADDSEEIDGAVLD